MKRLTTISIVLAAVAVHAGEVSSSLTQMTTLYHQGKFDAALGVYARIIKQTEPPPAEVQLVFFRILLAQGKQASAQGVMKDYVKQKPRDYRPWFEWGVIRTLMCGGPRAVAPLRKSITLNPNHAPSYLWLAQTTVPMQEKIQALHKVLHLEPRDSATAKKAMVMLEDIRERNRTTTKSTLSPEAAPSASPAER